jgi:hypothetical protein
MRYRERKFKGPYNPVNLWPKLMKLDKLYKRSMISGLMLSTSYKEYWVIYECGNFTFTIYAEKGWFNITSPGLLSKSFLSGTYCENKQVIQEWILQSKAESL